MSSQQQPTEPHLGATVANAPPAKSPPKRRPGRRRKDKSLPDTPSQGADNRPSQSSAYRPLAIAKRPTPDTQQAGSTGSTTAIYFWLSHLERIMSLGVAILQVTRKVKSAVISAVIQPLYEVNMETLLQESGSLQQSYLELKESVRDSMPSLACPWRSHFDKINSLALEISRVAWDLRTTTSQPLLEVDVQTLLQQSEDLHKSYFDLKACMQQPMLSLGGGKRSELITTGS